MFRSLSIIIPNYNGEKLFPEFFPSVVKAAENYQGKYELIIVDDCSPDNSWAVMNELKTNYSKVKIFKNEVNIGFSGACNRGIKEAKGEVLFFLNNDVKLKEDYFNYFNEYFNDSATFAITTCAYSYFDKTLLDGFKCGRWSMGMPRVTKNLFDEELIKRNFPKPYRSFSVQGAYFFASAAKVNSLEGFDELFAPYIFEETDLAYRALKRGWAIYYEPRCIAYHAVSSTISKKSSRSTKLISTKNKLIFVWKNIHSKRLMASHLFFLTLRLLTFNSIYWKAVGIAWCSLGEICKKRKIEKQQAVVSDKRLFAEYNFK